MSRSLFAARTVTAVFIAPLLTLGVLAAPAGAHDERPTRELDGTGSVPEYRTGGPTLLVCKTDRADFEERIAGFPEELRRTNLELWLQCRRKGFRDLQAAVDQAVDGTTIKMLPGLYQELPSLKPSSEKCAELTGIGESELYQYEILSIEQQQECPFNQNLVSVIGKYDIQIEGTGAEPEDVILDGQFEKLNVLRADNADGFYLRNITVQRSQFNAVYILETDGFVVDNSIGRWTDEYGFLTFAVDHGLYTEAEGYGNGDSAFYPGSASDINDDEGYDPPRYAVEIRDSYAHHNMLGYSGTAGDSVWVHDSVFTENSTGVSTDSAFPDHPGMPQNHVLFENNVIADNNVDYYRYFEDGTCEKPYAERGYEDGVVCPVVGVPVGAGVINPGGNYNTWRDNHIYGNEYAGFVTSWVPAFVRGEKGLATQFDTSHRNRYVDNHMGVTEDGEESPNGTDYWWDGQGKASCWTTASDSVDVSSNIGPLPSCEDDRPTAWASRRYVGEPTGILKMYTCGGYSLQDQRMPASCDWWGAFAAEGLERVEVRWAIGEAVLMTLISALLLLRRARRSLGGWVGVLGIGAGFGLVAAGVWRVTPVIEAAGLAVAGIGLLLLWRGLRPTSRKLGTVALWIGGFALLGAFDRGVHMIPWIPVSPALPRLLLELIWVAAALVTVLSLRRRASGSPAAALAS